MAPAEEKVPPEAALRLLEVAGRAIQVRHGGTGPAFVYLHSALGETAWLPFLQAWSRRFAVYAPAHPGFARSQLGEPLRTFSAYASHYDRLFDTLGLDRFCLGGLSLGGRIAVEFAARRPERVKKLWFCAAPGPGPEHVPPPELLTPDLPAERKRELLFADPASAAAQAIVRAPSGMSAAAQAAARRSHEALARLDWPLPEPSLLRRLAGIPTLIVWGAEDRLTPAAQAQAWLKLLPHARLHLLPKCGHLPIFEAEAEFARVTADFCGEEQLTPGGFACTGPSTSKWS